MNQIGERLKSARCERSLNLRQLAESSGVSASMLCTIENGKTTPSVQSLVAIANALKLPTGFFFGEDLASSAEPFSSAPVRSGPIVRQNSRKTIQLDHGVSWSQLTPDREPNVEVSELRYEPGAISGEEFYTHPGREWGYVLQGELHVDLAFETFVLNEGDTITFESQTPHRLRNESAKVMRAIWLNKVRA